MWRGQRHAFARGGDRGRSLALLMMLMRNVNQLDHKPPLTLGLMALMYALHFQKSLTPSKFRAYSLCPDKVVYGHDYPRLVVSALLHVDDVHLYHNMISFLWKGYHLEPRLGMIRFALVLCYLLLLCHVLVVVIAVGLDSVGMHEPLHQCSIGFSGVLFALKVLLNHGSPAFSNVYGFQVPTKYAAWLELVVIHMLVPRTSFMGHMCGILAGYIYVLTDSKKYVIDWIVDSVTHTWRQLSAPQPQEYVHRNAPSQPRASAQEDDEALERRLQEGEFRRNELHQRYSGYEHSNQQPEPSSISLDELRRRRVNRFEY
ncbi:hypothetical protein Poli38472_006415 [Pythium oligandrum]|uniref:Peptidase S54 rhomboid domain-containing protein n=1 Tax=Pythium oligandrum TaxID=41045 RepID=A0A8K1C4U7_PYTOL|nr:hypothetical protein Poli38472_006415 [Pythium oligandrum]|eukprot:TMW56405.1 hypothetical protein Poli38472_006415 [Pythium oligandrum]